MSVVVHVVAGITFMVWLGQARLNSDLLGVVAAVLAARVVQRINDRQLTTAPDTVVAQEVSR